MFLRDPEDPQGGGGTPAGAQSGGSPAPAQQPTATYKATDPIQIIGKDGKPVDTTLGEMAQAYRDRLSPEDIQEVELYRKALKDQDPAAMRQLMQTFLPNEEPPPDPNQQLQALNEKIARLEAGLGQIAPIAEQVRDASTIQHMNNYVRNLGDKAPLVSKFPKGGEKVFEAYKRVENYARSKGVNLNDLSPEHRQQALDYAVAQVEGELKAYSEFFGQTGSPARQAPPPSPGGFATPKGDQPVPAKWRVDHRQPGVVFSGPNQGENHQPDYVPPNPVAPPTGAAMPGMSEPAQGPMTPQSLRQAMRNRLATMGGGS